MQRLWVVEMRAWRRIRWVPTTGVSISREEARDICREWRAANPEDRFRIRKYVSA